MMNDKESRQWISQEWRRYQKYCVNPLSFINSKEDFYDYYNKTWYYGGHEDYFKFVDLYNNGELIAIDVNIADLIKYLNDVGCITNFCCSGHKYEKYTGGYIYFNSKAVEKYWNQLFVEDSDLIKELKEIMDPELDIPFSSLRFRNPKIKELGEKEYYKRLEEIFKKHIK